MSILIENVNKKFDQFQVLKDINLELKPGKLVALLGPSGSGKSTLLRTIAGLEKPDTGSIIINGQDTTNLDLRKRNIGFVFQHYALFKHLTIRENIAFGLSIRKFSRDKIKARVNELLALIQLEGLGDRYPSQLSGGQRQRVALARALAVQPQVLLLDEPFGALDAKVRKELRAWLRNLHDEIHVSTIFVTHDQEEAMEISDEIVIMNYGEIEQVGSPAEVYDNPASSFVMGFMGEVNIFPSHSPWFKEHKTSEVTSEIFIRPHEFDIKTIRHEETIEANVKRIIHLGSEIEVELILPDNALVLAHLSRNKYSQLDFKVDQKVFIKPQNARFFPKVLAA